MRNFLLLVLRFFMELTIANAIVSLLLYFFDLPEIIETGSGYYLLTVGLAVFLLFPPFSISERLLAYAVEEGIARKRQWPNLILGAANFMSGIIYMAAWTDPAMSPAVIGITNSPYVQYPIVIILGGFYVWVGVRLLQFLPYAKRLGVIAAIMGLCLTVWFTVIHRAEWLVIYMTKMAAKGREVSLEDANASMTMGLVGVVGLTLAQLVLAYLSRERATSA